MAAQRKRRRDESLPIAVATQGGLLTAIAVLLVGMIQGARAWILLIKAGTAFLITSAFLKLLAAGVMQAVRWQATPTDKPKREEDDLETADVQETADTIRTASRTPETTESVAS